MTSSDVNEYLRAVSDEDFTAKDFRTWAATAMAAIALAQCDPCPRTARRHNVNQVIAKIAQRLGNTKAVCRKSYIHPGVIEAYLDEALPPLAEAKSMGVGKLAKKGLCSEETAVLQVLELLSLPQFGKTGRQKPAQRRGNLRVPALIDHRQHDRQQAKLSAVISLWATAAGPCCGPIFAGPTTHEFTLARCIYHLNPDGNIAQENRLGEFFDTSSRKA